MKKTLQLLWLSCLLLLPPSTLAGKKDDSYCSLIYYAKTVDEKKELKICAKEKTIQYRFGNTQDSEVDIDLTVKKDDLYRNRPKEKESKFELFIPNGNTWYVLTIDKRGSYIKIYDSKSNTPKENLLSLFNIVKLSKSSQINNIENLKELKYQ